MSNSATTYRYWELFCKFNAFVNSVAYVIHISLFISKGKAYAFKSLLCSNIIDRGVKKIFCSCNVVFSRYMFAFAVGAGPVTGLIIPEISSNRTRGKIMGFSFSAHWVCLI